MTTEFNPQTTAPAEAPKSNKRRRALLILAAVIAVAAIIWTAWYLLVARWHQDTDDAYAQGNVVSITPQTAGTVVSIGVDDGMKVEAGQVLVQLDPNDAKVAYEQAVANLASAVRQVRGLYSVVDAGQAELDAQWVAVERARNDVARREGLVASGAVSASRGQLSRKSAMVDAGNPIAEQPQVRAAAAQLRQAYLALQRASIVAPVSGYVAQRHVQLGQRVQPGASLMTIVPLEQMWVEANFKETQLADMRIGQPVEVHADLYGDDITFDGTIGSLGMGTGSAFSLLPAQNASGNWIKIVQRVPVRIDLDSTQLAEHPLRMGLSMSVDVDVHEQDGEVLAAKPPAKPVLSTDAYSEQLANADALIEKIVRDNLAGKKHG